VPTTPLGKSFETDQEDPPVLTMPPLQNGGSCKAPGPGSKQEIAFVNLVPISLPMTFYTL
jgi:hypothetical protein